METRSGGRCSYSANLDLEEATGELSYTFPPGVEERLFEPALYSYLSLRAIYQFESKYGLILYEILKRYANRAATEPYWAVQTSQLRELLGCRDHLKDWKDFRRWALNPAVDEIDRISEFKVEIFETRQGGGRGGGKVVGITFRIHSKERLEAEQAVRELDKPRLQRRGEQKSGSRSVRLPWRCAGCRERMSRRGSNG